MLNKTYALLIVVFLSITRSSLGTELECKNIPKILDFFLQGHLVHRTMTPELKSHAEDQFIKFLDGSKTVLLESDLPKVREAFAKQFNSANTGDCSPLKEIQDLLISRTVENEEIVKKILDDKYQIDKTTELATDSKKRNFSKTVEEKTDLLKKMIHFQMQNLLISDIKFKEAKKQLIHRYELSVKRLKEEKMPQIIAAFLDNAANGLDPHSSFMSTDLFEDFQISMRLSLEGIGASLRSQDGFTVVEELIKGGSAEKAKVILPKDKIIAVTQENGAPVSIIDMDLRDVVKLIRGKKGTKVTLTILRQGDETKTFQTTLVRQKVELTDQAAKITYEDKKVGTKTYKIAVIELPSFYGASERGGRSSSSDMERLLIEAREKKVDGIVLNVSRNGGGLLDEAVQISGLFLRKGGVVATKERAGKVAVLEDGDEAIIYSGPLVVLTSRLSASASEILAGSLKDYRRAVIVGGDHTFGKGSVQSLRDLPSGNGAVKVTTGLYFIPGGTSTQRDGVASDIVLPSVLNGDEVGEKNLDYSLPPQKIESFTSVDANGKEKPRRWEPVTDALVETLAKKSKERIAKDEKFLEIQKKIEKEKKNQGIVKISEITKDDKKKKMSKKDKKEPEKSDQDEEKTAFVQEATWVLADLIAERP